jgi:hypothetical protein
MSKKAVAKAKNYYIQSGNYKTTKIASSTDEAAIQAIKYMMAEQIGCGLLLFVSRYGYFEAFTEETKKKCSVYFIPNILALIGEEEYSDNLKEHYENLGFDVGELESKFGKMKKKTSQKILQEQIESLQKELASTTQQLQQLEEAIEDSESIEDDTEGEEWKN